MNGKKAKVGGQAVIEGVMMRGPKNYSVAIKKSNGNILLDKKEYHSVTENNPLLKLFIIRGIVSFFESITLGMKTLIFSADYFDEETGEQKDIVLASHVEQTTIEERKSKDMQQGWVVFVSILLSLLLTIVLFFILPTYVAGLFFNNVDADSRIWYNTIEGAMRVGIFLLYLAIISNMKDIRRVFQYHGAEHKSINCYESGLELNVENVKAQSKYHPRCGTSFVFIVMIISIIVFAFFKSDNIWMAILQRILLLPLIAGLSYEVIKFFGMFKGKVARALAMPGMWFQCFTTKEPDDLQIYVAITALKAVLPQDGE